MEACTASPVANAAPDHTVSEQAVPERTSSLAATTSATSDRELFQDLEHLSVVSEASGEDHNVPSRAVSMAQAAAAVATSRSAARQHPPPATNLTRRAATTNSNRSAQFTPLRADDAATANINELTPVPESSTTLDVATAPPVVHETVKVERHEIIQKVVQKEIHETLEVTRILPVIETELLPARHFILTEDGRKVECALADVPVGNTISTVSYHVGGDSSPAKLSSGKDDLLGQRQAANPG